MAEYIGRRIVPTHGGVWNETKEYEELVIVLDEESGDSYISRISVPSGTALDDEEYWMLFSIYSEQIQEALDALEETSEELKEYADNTATSLTEYVQETATELTEYVDQTAENLSDKVEEAEELTESNKDELNERMDSLETRLDANVTASTDSDADYAAEVVDARVDALDETHDSLGDAIRSIPYGLAEKCIPEKTGTAKNYSNTASISVDGCVCNCSLYYEDSGYAGVFAGFFGTYDDCRDKKFRVFVIGTAAVTLQAIVTNNYCAWGDTDGNVGSISVGSITLTEDNEYFAAVDIDFSEDKWETFAETYSTSGGMFFCIRCPESTGVDTSFSMYAYEMKPGRSSEWRYVSGDDDVYLLEKEVADARGEYDTLGERIETASESSEWATFADNYFLNSPDDLLNEDGVRYSEGMDSLDLPSESPYSFAYAFQSLVSSGSAVSSGSGLTKSIAFSMELDASSSQPANQGYVKQLSGMLSVDTILSKFEEGYANCYICSIENVNYPEESSSGSYTQNLLISYKNSSGSAVLVAGSQPAATAVLSGNIKMYVWKFSFDDDVMEEIAASQEAGTFSTVWFGIWNTRKYTGDDPITWDAVWYWQDFAFTDGSFSNEDMLSFFQSKYVYWASYVNHLRLKEKLEALDELEETVDELQEMVDTEAELFGSTKLYGVTTGIATSGSNTVTLKLDGYNYVCTMHHEGSGYVGAFFGFFGDYEDCAGKQFRVLIVGSSEVTLQAVVTNARNAWGSTDGTIGSVSVQSISLTEDNGYTAIIDIDFSEDKWATFVENYTYSSTLYLCLRYQTTTAMDTQFTLCAYERDESIISDGKYVTSDDDIYLLEETLDELQESLDELSESLDGLSGNDESGGIVCWGDSLTAGGGWTTTLASLSGLTVYNAGTGGENAQTIMARQGADVMIINDITIPAECEAVTIATRADDTGITTQAGHTVTPLLQGGTAHVNPVMIGDVEGVLAWTGESYSDTTGTWTFTRSEAGDEVVITRPTAIRTAYDRNHNGENEVMVIFMGQNGGYNSDVSELIRMHHLMIDHFKGKEYVILGLSSGTASSRADYEEAMEEEFGRRFISLREYLAHPLYDEDGETIISCYGLDDAGLDATDDDLEAIAEGQVPSTLLSDSVHYTSDTKTVIGNLLYKKMVELGIL